MKFGFVVIPLLIICFTTVSICQKDITIENMSGRTESFWKEYFGKRKEIDSFEGIYTLVTQGYDETKGLKTNERLEKIVVVAINQYHYILLESVNHRFKYVKRTGLGYYVKGERLGDYDKMPKDASKYFNFWGSTFQFNETDKFNVTIFPVEFDVKGAKVPYLSTGEKYGKNIVGQIINNKLIFSKSIDRNYSEINILSKVFPLFESENNISQEWKGNGTGFLVHSSGYIVTNHHVIDSAKEIEIEMNSNKYRANVAVFDKINDIAILKIDVGESPIFNSNNNIPYCINTEIMDVGSSVFTLGYPYALSGFGKELKFTDGKISSKTGFNGDITNYQISVPIQGGNSGGPLIDMDGNIVGVITSKVVSKDIDNVAYAIKAHYLNTLFKLLPVKIIVENKCIDKSDITEKVKKISPFIALIKVK